MNVKGESMVMQGSIDSSGILNMQSVEPAEVGASLDGAPGTVFAQLTLLKRTSDDADVGTPTFSHGASREVRTGQARAQP